MNTHETYHFSILIRIFPILCLLFLVLSPAVALDRPADPVIVSGAKIPFFHGVAPGDIVVQVD